MTKHTEAARQKAEEIINEILMVAKSKVSVTDNQFLIWLNESFAQAIENAVRAEQEQNALLAERNAREIIDMQTGLRSNPGQEIAAKIRDRGKP